MNSEEDEDLDYSQFYQDTDEWDEGSYDKSKGFDERYQSPELIATGGMKEIYKIYDTMTCRHIAMAQLRKDVSEEHCESFMKEAYLTASMEHPNIISVYDVGLKENNEPYFTMELKVGDTLSQLMNKDKVSLTGLLEIFLKICDAISYAHSCENLHLDIKPDNIQVGTFGEVQVCDWGLGSHINDLQNSQEGIIKGTPGYMAPEQVKPNGIIDKQTDVYALGALLYSILTGKIPVAGGVNTIIVNTVKGGLEFPAERFPDMNIPESLDAVVRKAMAYEKEDRYPSVDLLKKEVNQFLTGHSTEAENAGFIKEFSLFYKRNKAISQVVFAALFLISLGSSFFIMKLNESNNAKDKALNNLTKSHNDLKISRAKEKEAFEKFKEQKEAQEKVSKELHDEQFAKARAYTLHPVYFNDPIKFMDMALVDLKKQYNETGRLYIAQNIIKNLFISQQFKEIEKYEATEMKPLADLAKNYTEFKTSRIGALKDYRFLKILRDLNALPEKQRRFRYSIMERMIYYQMALQNTDYTSIEVLTELIKSRNPGWDETKMTFEAQRRSLTISGENLTKIIASADHSANKCFFSLFKIDKLSVQDTGLKTMHQFVGLNVKELDIRNTNIASLIPEKALHGISQLLINKHQIEKSEIRQASENTEIIVKGKRVLNAIE